MSRKWHVKVRGKWINVIWDSPVSKQEVERVLSRKFGCEVEAK